MDQRDKSSTGIGKVVQSLSLSIHDAKKAEAFPSCWLYPRVMKGQNVEVHAEYADSSLARGKIKAEGTDTSVHEAASYVEHATGILNVVPKRTKPTSTFKKVYM